jgi:hypothetical protein
MDKHRFVDKREHRFDLFEPIADDPTLVICPQCEAMGKGFLNSHLEGRAMKAELSACRVVSFVRLRPIVRFLIRGR